MKAIFDQLSMHCSRSTTLRYSTSFSLGIRFLHRRFHNPIYAVYGFVRFADEIVDSFHDYDKKLLLDRFEEDTWRAIEEGISLNPILNSFQHVVRTYQVDHDLITCFLKSMRTDLDVTEHCRDSILDYILGSAEVVGLMCLRIFTEGDKEKYEALKPAAMKLGSAFQKVNFLRDARNDMEGLNRNYFPQVHNRQFTKASKQLIEEDIEQDFREALVGIRELPAGARGGVYLAYYYYLQLFKKIRRSTADRVMEERIRINNANKMVFMLQSYMRHQFNML